MMRSPHLFRHLVQFPCILLTLLGDIMRFLRLCLRPSVALAAENLFLRKQLALYQARQIQPRRVTNATRSALVWLARWCNWRQALVIVQPQTLIRWHRQGFRLFWRWKSRPGRPPIPPELQALMCRMARENLTWGEERIANELLLKLGLRVSPRTVRKYMPQHVGWSPGTRVQVQRWRTCVRNHVQAIVACDFCVAMTATFRMLYVLVVIDHASRRLLHVNVTAHPIAEWTLQQLPEAILSDHRYRCLIHDRDHIFSQQLDQYMRRLGLRVLKTPPQAPQANAICGCVLGTLRQECLDLMIPLTETHLRHMVREWVRHDNAGRPHMSLGPGIPQPLASLPVLVQRYRHRLPEHLQVMACRILGGLHHDYRLEEKAS